MAAWETEFVPLDKIPEKYPPVEMNEKARRLQELSMELGLAIQFNNRAELPQVPEQAAKEWSEAKTAISELVKS